MHNAPVELLLVWHLRTLLSESLKNTATTSATLQTSWCLKCKDIAAYTTVATVDCSRGHFKLESNNGPQSKALCMPQIVTLKLLRSQDWRIVNQIINANNNYQALKLMPPFLYWRNHHLRFQKATKGPSLKSTKKHSFEQHAWTNYDANGQQYALHK